MKHARADYDRIQDPAGLIPEDEPVFLIRGQDSIGAAVVLMWSYLAQQAGASHDICERARQHAIAMLHWEPKKIPDMPKEDTQ